MVSKRQYYVYWVGVLLATLLLFGVQIVNDSDIQVVMIIGSLVLALGPLLYEPRLQIIGWKTGVYGPTDERHEQIIYRTGWYAYHFLLGVVAVYYFVNSLTDYIIPLWGLGFGMVGVFTGYWVIALWQSQVM